MTPRYALLRNATPSLRIKLRRTSGALSVVPVRHSLGDVGSSRRRIEPGFSLIEMMIVIALLAIVITLASVSTNFMHTVVARTEVDLLHATCCNLQQRAIATRQEQTLAFDETTHSYNYHGNVHKLPPTVQFAVLPEAKGPPSEPTHALSSAITFANKTIIFHPDGIIQAGAVYVLDVPGSKLYALSSWVSPVSFLRKYRYDGKWYLIE